MAISWIDVIRDNIELIEQNNWKTFYEERDLTNYSVLEAYCEATKRILAQGIDIFKYMDYVPPYFLDWSDVPIDFVLPRNVTLIQNCGFYGCDFENFNLPRYVKVSPQAFEQTTFGVLVIESTDNINSEAFINCTIEVLDLPNDVDLSKLRLVDKIGQIIYNGSETEWKERYEEYVTTERDFLEEYDNVYKGVKIKFRYNDDMEML